METAARQYGLRPIELKDKEIFDQAFSRLSAPVSDFSFANTFIWRDALSLSWTMIDGHVCVFSDAEGDLRMALPPIGDGDLARALKACYEIMDDYNGRTSDTSHSVVECVTDELLDRYAALGFTAVPTGGDYVYDTRRMIDLAGGDLKSKRQARTKFLREHGVRTAALSPGDVGACKELLASWQGRGDARRSGDDPFHLRAESLRRLDRMATELALDALSELGLAGMTLWAEERIVGFTLGEALTPRQASILIEKTDLDLDGSAQFIFSEFCRTHWAAYPECNVGDDWGLPSLRWTKMSYRPIRIMGKYSVLPERARMSGWTPAAHAAPLLITEANPRHMTSAGVPQEHDPASVRIGRAEAGEFAALAGLEERIFGREQAITKRQMRYILNSGRAIVSVARTPDGGVIGWAIMLVRRHKNNETARLYSLAVDPEWRGKGLGQRLAEDVLNEVEAMGITRCFLEVADDNDGARRLYERLGFQPVATLPDYYGEGRHGRRMLRVARERVEPAQVPAATLSRPLGLV